tara:strand:+ start:774 stop:1013 length:240 start_codon:yes stop_codon:yes gene_type:complete
MFGFDSSKAGIASEAFLVLIVIAWTGSYFFRVITGNMTFTEQRKRYRKAYNELTDSKIQSTFDSLSKEEQNRLLEDLEE